MRGHAFGGAAPLVAVLLAALLLFAAFLWFGWLVIR